MKTYYTYDESTKQLKEAKRVIFRDGRMIVLGNPADFARYLEAYPKGESASPDCDEGYYAVADGYELVEGKWVRKWRVEELPPPPPRTFSKLRLEDALFRAGVLDVVDAFVDAQTITNEYGQTIPLRRKYETANDLSESHPLFDKFKIALQNALGWTDEQVEKVLAEAEIKI